MLSEEQQKAKCETHHASGDVDQLIVATNNKHCTNRG